MRLRYETVTTPRSIAPLSVSAGRSIGSPHTISTEKAPSRPSIGCSRPLATVRGGSIATSVWRQPTISSNPTLGTFTLTTTGSTGRSASTAATTSAPTRAAVSQCWPAIISSQPWPSTPYWVTAWLIATPLVPPLRAVERGADRARSGRSPARRWRRG